MKQKETTKLENAKTFKLTLQELDVILADTVKKSLNESGKIKKIRLARVDEILDYMMYRQGFNPDTDDVIFSIKE